MSFVSQIDLVADLQAMIGAANVSNRQADRALHARDQSAYAAVTPDVVIWPQSTAQISQILQYASQRSVPVTAWGAGTSIEGNPIPLHGGIVLSLRDMNRILALHREDFQVTVQPGLLYKDMNKVLARDGLFFPPDPGANASIGGMLANNAAGTRTVKYGATRDNVLALQVVLANGQVVRTGSRSVKQSSGYDLTHLFVGSEGTLGVITEATLKIYPIPTHYSAATVAFSTIEDAAQTVYEIVGSGLEPAALELLDAFAVGIINAETELNLYASPNLFVEFSGANATALEETLAMLAEICRDHGCVHYQAGVGSAARARLWEARHSVFEAHVRHFPGQQYLVTDVSVPISRYPELIAATHAAMEQTNAKGSIVSHAGDGNAHVIVFYPPDDESARQRVLTFNDRLVELALSLEGTATGEHGVGLGKQKFMLREHGLEALNLMQDLKGLLDPGGILNPGKVIPAL